MEIGVGVPGVLSASVTAGYNFKSNEGYWSVQGSIYGLYGGYGSSGWFAGYGYRYAGLSIGVGYGANEGWNAGLSYGGTYNNFNGSAGIGWSQKGGFDWNVTGGYTFNIEEATRTKIGDYSLEGAPENGLKQRGGFDCLICATEYLDQMSTGRSYEEILAAVGDLYNPETGTNTMAALRALYGDNNVTGYAKISPLTIGRELQNGNPVIMAQNSNHAIALTKIEHWQKTYKSHLPKNYFKIRYMNPATGSFGGWKTKSVFKSPTYIINFK